MSEVELEDIALGQDKEKQNKEILNDHKNSRYDPDQTPPILDLAIKHQKANRIGIVYNLDEFCPCCSKPVNKNGLSVCIAIDKLGFIGPLFPLYFKYMLYCLVLITIMGSLGFIMLIINSYQGICQKTPQQILDKYSYNCKNSSIIKYSLINNQNLDSVTYVNLATILLIIIFNHLFIKYSRQNEINLDKAHNTPGDYTIMIQNLPKGEFTEDDIVELFEDFFAIPEHTKRLMFYQHQDVKSAINKINISYNLETYFQSLNKKNLHLKKKLNAEDYYKKNNEYPKDYDPEATETILKELEELIEKTESQVIEKDNKNTTGVVFVSFQRQEIQQYILDNYANSIIQKLLFYLLNCTLSEQEIRTKYPQYFYFKGQRLVLEQAPEPDDIIWQNLGLSKIKLFGLFLMSNFAILVVLGICFGLIMLIYHIQESILSSEEQSRLKKSDEVGDKFSLYSLTIIGSMFIVVVNTALMVNINIFSNKLRLPTLTHISTNIAKRLSISQFINTAIIILIVETSIKDRHLIEGLVINTITIFISNAFMTPFLNIFNIWYLIRMIKRKIIANPEKNQTYTQKEAQFWYQGAPLMMEYKYALTTKTLMLTAFYISFQPLVAPISFVGILFSYWVDKYLLLNRYQEPKLLSVQINRTLTGYFDYIPLCISVGAKIMKGIIFDEQQNKVIVRKEGGAAAAFDNILIILSIVNFMIPNMKLNTMIFGLKNQDTTNHIKYDEARRQFITEYDRANPVTQEQAMNEWFDYQEEQGIIKNAQEMKERQKKQNMQDRFQIILQQQTAMNNQTRQFDIIRPMQPVYHNPITMVAGNQNLALLNYQQQYFRGMMANNNVAINPYSVIAQNQMQLNRANPGNYQYQKQMNGMSHLNHSNMGPIRHINSNNMSQINNPVTSIIQQYQQNGTIRS